MSAGRGVWMSTHIHMDQRGRVPQTTTPRGDVLASTSIPKFPGWILQSLFPPTFQAARSSEKQRGEHQQTLCVCVCVCLYKYIYPAAFPADTLLPKKSKDAHTKSHWPQTIGKKVKLKHQRHRKINNSGHHISEREGGNSQSLFVLCSMLPTHADVHPSLCICITLHTTALPDRPFFPA